MIFDPPLKQAVLLRRYKRFLADLKLPGGEIVQAHVPNTGRMTGCAAPGSRAWYSTSTNPRRKLAHTLEIVESAGVLAGVNTARTNALVAEALDEGIIEPLAGRTAAYRREVTFGDSRLDFLLEGPEGEAFMEVKNVTLTEGGAAIFPDAVTLRGRKHLLALRRARETGRRAIIFFLVQRADGDVFRPADSIDPEYGSTLREVHRAGVEILAYRAAVTPAGIRVSEALPVDLAHGAGTGARGG